MICPPKCTKKISFFCFDDDENGRRKCYVFFFERILNRIERVLSNSLKALKYYWIGWTFSSRPKSLKRNGQKKGTEVWKKSTFLKEVSDYMVFGMVRSHLPSFHCSFEFTGAFWWRHLFHSLALSHWTTSLITWRSPSWKGGVFSKRMSHHETLKGRPSTFERGTSGC